MPKEIKSLYGRWRGNTFNGLSGKTAYGSVLFLVNETRETIVYSAPFEFAPGKWTDEIVAAPGEAICYIHPGDEFSQVAVSGERYLVNWIGYYFFSPQFSTTLNVLDGRITVSGVPVTLKMLKSYSPKVKKEMYLKIFGKAHVSASQRRTVKSLLGVDFLSVSQ